MVEEVKSAVENTLSVQELLAEPSPLPLVSPFVSGTPCVTPEGESGTVVSDTLILEGPDGRGGTRQFVASYWDEARLHVGRGANLCAESTLRVRVQGKIRRFHAGEVRVVVRRDLAVDDEA
ncbi:MAG: hypothetical protein ACM3US_07780 [Sphingomonadaceae bacterium]